jgi:hypothetical protein
MDYLRILDANRDSGPEYAATTKPRAKAQRRKRKAKPLTPPKNRARLRKSTPPTQGKERASKNSRLRKAPMAKKRRSKKQRAAAKRNIKKAQAALRAKKRGHVKSPKRRRARRSKASETPKRRRKRARKNPAPKRRRKRRKSHASDWPGQRVRHRKAAKKGWAKRRRRHAAPKKRRSSGHRKARRTKKQIAAARRNIRKAHAHRRSKYASQGRRSRSSRREDYASDRRRRRRRGRSRRNPSQYGLTGGELIVASIFGTIGFLAGDAVDRGLATHQLTDKGTKDPTTGQELFADTPPTTGAYAGLFNPTAICAPMDAKRWIVGLLVPAATFAVAAAVKAPMARASMQFAAFGYGVRVVGKGAIDALAVLTKGTSVGLRLYDGEARASVLKANNGNQQAPELGLFPAAGLGTPQLTEPCAPCADKAGAGYPSMPRQTVDTSTSSAPNVTVSTPAPPPPPPPPQAPPTQIRTTQLTGVPNGASRPDRYNWGAPE